jgi:ABC-type transport system substrate-binding protein
VFILNSAPGSVFDGNFALREAVAYACDFEAMCQASTRGTGEYTGVYGNSSLSGYNEAWKELGYQRDVDLAKEKLAEAGYKEGELTLRYVTNSNDEVFLVLQSSLAEAGINVELNLLDETQFLTTRQQANTLEWDMLYYGCVPKGFETNILYSLAQIDAYDFGAIGGFKDQELFDLCYKARYSQDQADIDAAYENLLSKLYYLPTWDGYGFEGAYSKIEGLVKDSSLELIAQASIFADDYDIYYEG